MRRSVLILDEEMDFLRLTRGYYRRKNWEAYCAPTLNDAFALLQKANIDVIMVGDVCCDNWHRVEKQIKTLSPGTKIIYMNRQAVLQEFMRNL